MADKLLRIIISGDAKGALGAFAETEAGADNLGGKFSSLGGMATAAGVVVGAAFVGAGVALFKIGESFDEAYDKIRVGTGSTGPALEALKDDFRNVVSSVPTDFGKAGDAITAVVSKLGLDAGPGLDQLTSQFLELSRITGTDLATNIDEGSKALLNWNVPVDQYSAKMDEIFRTSQLTGVSFADLTGQLESTGVQLRTAGFDFEQSTAIIATMNRAGIEAADIAPALSKAMAVAAKEGKPAAQVFQETFASIKSAPDDMTAAGTALDVFGAKAGPKFAAMIREGKLDYEGLMGAIGSGKDTIIGAGQDTMDFSEKWDLFKNRVMVALEPLAMAVFDGVGKAMDTIGPYATQFSKWFSENLPKAMAALQPWVDRFSTVIQDIAGFITTRVIPAIQGLTKFLRDHDEILKGVAITIGILLIPAFVGWAISAGIAAINTIIAIAPVIALGIALALLVAGIIWVVENFDIFKDAGAAAFNWVKDAAGTAIGWIQDRFDGIVDFITGLPGRMKDAAAGLWDWLYDSLTGAIDTVIGLLNSGIDFLNGFQIHVHKTMPSIIPNIDIDWDGLGIPHIPMLAEGGVTTGPMLALLGDNPSGREAIVPLDKAGDLGLGGGDTYHFHNHGIISSQAELDRWLNASLERLGAGGRRLGPGARKLFAAP